MKTKKYYHIRYHKQTTNFSSISHATRHMRPKSEQRGAHFSRIPNNFAPIPNDKIEGGCGLFIKAVRDSPGPCGTIDVIFPLPLRCVTLQRNGFYSEIKSDNVISICFGLIIIETLCRISCNTLTESVQLYRRHKSCRDCDNELVYCGIREEERGLVNRVQKTSKEKWVFYCGSFLFSVNFHSDFNQAFFAFLFYGYRGETPTLFKIKEKCLQKFNLGNYSP